MVGVLVTVLIAVLGVTALGTEAPAAGEPTLAAEGAAPTEPTLAEREDVILVCDFENEDWWKAWGAREQPGNTDLIGPGRKAFRGRSLRVTVKQGSHMGTGFAYKFARQDLPEPEEIYFRYYVRFDADWVRSTGGGKMPGISGTYGRAGWGGRRVNGRDGWSARGHFGKTKGSRTPLGFYCYHADMRGRYGSSWDWGIKDRGVLRHERWYCVQEYCRLNTPGRRDGVLRAWIDGQPAFEKTDIRFRDVPDLKIEQIWFNVYHGGSWVPKADIHVYFDNVVIARKPIGPVPRRRGSGGR